MKNVPLVEESSSRSPCKRPNWPWWIVMWKAFVTLFIIGGCGILFLWSMRIEALFGYLSHSNAGFGIAIVSATFKALSVWALWAFSTSVWTERQNLSLKGGLIVGILFSAFRLAQSTQETNYEGDQIAVAIRENLPLPFWLLTFSCVAWELRRQFRKTNKELEAASKGSAKTLS